MILAEESEAGCDGDGHFFGNHGEFTRYDDDGNYVWLSWWI